MTSPPAEASEYCAGCGLPVSGGTRGCQEIFERFLARDFSDAAYFASHRMLVDTYSLQHPERYCASAKSLAAHLTGLGWLLEHGGSRAVGNEALRRWLDGTPPLAKPELPAARGQLTIGDLPAAADPHTHAQEVERWARSTWAAYAPLQPLARRWIQQAEAAVNPSRARPGLRSS
jgi:uncharacterized protein DUF5946